MFALLAMGLSGCAQWSPEPTVDVDGGLPTPKLSPDSVVVETVLVRFPEQASDEIQGLWDSVDESIFDIELRKKLDKNGLRAGLLIGEIPLPIRDRLYDPDKQEAAEVLESAGLAADIDSKMRRLTCRAGRRKELMVRPEVTHPLTVVTTLDGRLAGETFQRPAVLFDLRAIPHPNGQATLEMTPEIQHGDLRKEFVTSEYGMRPEMRREQAVWQELTIRARLSPGQTLMLSSTLPCKALGKAFFLTRTAEQTEEHVVMLVRLAATQLDELFDPESVEKARALTER